MAAGMTDARGSKKKTPGPQAAPEPAGKDGSGRSRLVLGLKIGVALLLVLALVLFSFAVGIYFKFIDPQELGQRYGLAGYPLIGSYFQQPATNFEPVPLPEEAKAPPAAVTAAPPLPPPVAAQPQSVPVTAEEREKMLKKQQQEEAKRISRLARLYGAMKPEEAAGILGRLDDASLLAIFSKMEEEQVAKLLPLFDSSRAARLTQSMMRPPKME